MLKKQKDKASFIPFVVTGHPNFDLCEKVIDVLVEEGAELLELGIPFSDAGADGPVIQQASESMARSLDSIEDSLAFAMKIHKKHPKLSLVLFTYFNPILKRGLEAFAKGAAASGISGVLVVDLPPEEAGEYLKCLEKNHLQSVFLAAPTTSESRFKKIAEASTGFVYYVSRLGVTGVKSELSKTLSSELSKLRTLTDKAIAVGFGISTGPQAREVAEWADAVVIGSAFVKILSQEKNEAKALDAVRTLAREISSSLMRRHE